ncbi:MAG: hypothetical protein COV79_01020 [Parcubacteria group bacterium CG11_big_fil_rev_8_21_14_0_20_41_14]|nr:MAG: hypothetical protein COV79_01020 [Parcubacteria group bacterium CG11_big_fil_rev_8_21_14_0_20_41_14]
MVQRGSRYRGRKQRRNNNQRRPKVAHCQMCKRKTRENLKRWNNLLVCGGCYKMLCKGFISGKNLRKKILKSIPRPKPKSFWERLFGV